ncbi:hypothetical protein IM538_09175 [Cytobacillus suaedae]|nr:hypothetical protein IM538_09175 [Cytobacillus suaedae]
MARYYYTWEILLVKGNGFVGYWTEQALDILDMYLAYLDMYFVRVDMYLVKVQMYFIETDM